MNASSAAARASSSGRTCPGGASRPDEGDNGMWIGVVDDPLDDLVALHGVDGDGSSSGRVAATDTGRKDTAHDRETGRRPEGPLRAQDARRHAGPLGGYAAIASLVAAATASRRWCR